MLQKLRRMKNSRKGFTLIELIIVIAILGVLATILVPTMLGIVRDSQRTVNLANARSVYSVAQAIAVQWDVSGKGGSIASSTDSTVPTKEFLDAVEANMGTNFRISDYTITLDSVGGNTIVKSVEHKDSGVTYPEVTSSSTGS